MSSSGNRYVQGDVGTELRQPMAGAPSGVQHQNGSDSSSFSAGNILHSLAVARTQNQQQQAAALRQLQQQEEDAAKRRIQELIEQQQQQQQERKELSHSGRSSLPCTEVNRAEGSLSRNTMTMTCSSPGAQNVDYVRNNGKAKFGQDNAHDGAGLWNQTQKCPHPVANPDDPPDSFVVVELPRYIVAGDRVRIPIPARNGMIPGSDETVTSLPGSKEMNLTLIVPSDYAPLTEGDRFLIVNTTLREGDRLIMPHPSHILSTEDLATPRQTSPRKTPLQLSSERRQSIVRPRESKGSRVGENYQVASIPPCQGSHEFQHKLQLLQKNNTTEELSDFVGQYKLRSEAICELVYDPKVENMTLPEVLRASRPGESHADWSTNDCTVFHRVMVRSMKNYPFVAKATKKRIVEVLQYYYGTYKQTKQYKAFKATCPKHADDYILCRVCKKEKADITCDLCTDAYHLKCLKPALKEMPVDEVWHCIFCKDEERRTRRSAVGGYSSSKCAEEECSQGSMEIVPPPAHSSKERVACAADASQSAKSPIQPSNSSVKVSSRESDGTTNVVRNSGKKREAENAKGIERPSMDDASKINGSSGSGTKKSKKSEALEVSNPTLNRVSSNSTDKRNNEKSEPTSTPGQKTDPNMPTSSSSQKYLSDGDTSDDGEDQDAAKLGRPEYITKKSDLAFFGDVRFHLPSPNADNSGDDAEDDGIPWKIEVGDIVAFRIEGASPPSYFKNTECSSGTKEEMKKIWEPFEVPWSPGEILSICWVPEGVNMTTFRQHLNKKVDPSKENYYSVKVDLEDVIIEVRWLYRCTEIQNSLQSARPKKNQSPAKTTKEKFCSPETKKNKGLGFFEDPQGRPVDEIWETDHVDEVDLSNVLGPIRLLSSEDELADSILPVKSSTNPEYEVVPARLVCRKFYFAQRMKETEFPMWIGSTRLERGIHLSPRLKKAPAYRSMRAKESADAQKTVKTEKTGSDESASPKSGVKRSSKVVI